MRTMRSSIQIQSKFKRLNVVCDMAVVKQQLKHRPRFPRCLDSAGTVPARSFTHNSAPLRLCVKDKPAGDSPRAAAERGIRTSDAGLPDAATRRPRGCRTQRPPDTSAEVRRLKSDVLISFLAFSRDMVSFLPSFRCCGNPGRDATSASWVYDPLQPL